MSELGRVVTELQVKGLRDGSLKGNRGRRGGAGPSDHRALEFDGTTVMVPIYNDASSLSPYSLDACGDGVALNGLQQVVPPSVSTPVLASVRTWASLSVLLLGLVYLLGVQRAS